jgi:hypothetical protein
MRKLYVILVISILCLSGRVFSQSTTGVKPNIVLSERVVSGKTISDDISEFIENPRVRQFWIFIIAVYFGYRIFKSKKLKERENDPKK